MNTPRIVLIGSVICAAASLFFINSRETTVSLLENSQSLEVSETPVATGDHAIEQFVEWRAQHSASANPSQLTEGIRLANERRTAMRALMRHDPDAALEAAISYAAYAKLPEEIQALIEEPFSESASLYVEISCGENHISQIDYYLETQDQSRLKVYLPSKERISLSKRDLPLQGIRLDGIAVIRGTVFQKLNNTDTVYVQNNWPAGQSNPEHSYVSGKPIEGDGISAIAGGRYYRFQDEVELQKIEEALFEADQLPGLDVGSQWITRTIEADGFPFEQFSQEMASAAYASTTGNKTALFLLVTFPDRTAAPVSAVTLEQVIDLDVSNALVDYSYGDTSMDATVYPTLIQVDHNSGDYIGGDLNEDDIQDTPYNSSDLYEEAVDKYMATVGTATDPRTLYDTVGIYFTEIGYSWAGLASVGGQRMWIENTTSSGVILHEFGHNYGLSHANYWVHDATNAASTDPVDPTGEDDEYGDEFDVMGSGSTEDGHFHMGAKQFLGWIQSNAWDDLSTNTDNGTYRVYRIDGGSRNGLQALRIGKSDTSDHYWVGYRNNYSDLESFSKGVYLTWERAGGNPSRNQSWLIDTTPGSTDGIDDAPIALGLTYSDTASDVYITPIALGGSTPDEYIDLVVNFGPFPGNAAPDGSISGYDTVEARQLVLFSASVTDADGDTLAYSWDMGDGEVKANSPTITYIWNSSGTYEIALTVSDMKGGSVRLTKNITVNDPLSTWSPRTSGTIEHLYGIVANENYVVALGGDYDSQRDADPTILRSSDGATWADVSPNNDYLFFRDGVWTGSAFYVVGHDYDFTAGGWEGVIYSSTDGQNWTLEHETNTADTQLFGIAYDGSSTLVAVGRSATVLRQSGAGSWGSVSTGITSTHILQDVAYGDSNFVLVGHTTTPPPAFNGDVAVFRSTDGLSWNDVSSNTGLSSWMDFREIEFLEGEFHAGGFYAQPRRSADAGQNWSTAVSGDRYQIEGFASIDGLHYAVGRNRDDSAADADLISTDGVNWTAIDPGALDDRNEITDFNSTFITVGENGSIRQSGMVANSIGFEPFAEGYFPGGGSDAEEASNPDFDWANNLIEYALGGNPDSTTDVPARPTMYFDESDYAVFEIVRDAKQQDVAYSVWWSQNLETWTQAGLTIIEDTATSLKVRTNQTFDQQDKAFFRLQLDR